MTAYACSSWTLVPPPYNDRGDEVFATIARLGFDAVELPVLSPADAVAFAADVPALRASALRHGLSIARLAVFEPLSRGLLASAAAAADGAAALVEVLDLAVAVGSPRITLRAPWPAGIKTPTLTPPEYFYINVPDMPGPGYDEADYQPDWRYETKFRIGVPDDVDWSAEFERFTDRLAEVVEAAADRGLAVELENQYGTLVPHTDTLLRVFDRIPSPHLVASLNVAQSFLQRELVPWSIRKLKGRVSHLRVADGDGLACYNLPPGSGTLDYTGIAEALAEIGFDGDVTCTWLNDIEAEQHLSSARGHLATLFSRAP
ncbi:MAG: sugar phosphate isomerase/epimerase [Microbacterium sp.]|uniref:sugar phosphate isomerase/epimerase family protein n=1 Tax=Microbacterium sp. TaxID=51671 RepID=UPI0039E2DD6D